MKHALSMIFAFSEFSVAADEKRKKNVVIKRWNPSNVD